MGGQGYNMAAPDIVLSPFAIAGIFLAERICVISRKGRRVLGTATPVMGLAG